MLVLSLSTFATVVAALRQPKALIPMEIEASPDFRGLPAGWESIGPASGNGVQLVFALKQTNLPALESKLLAVSDPFSDEYGQHLTNEEVHALVAPLPQHVAAVKEFLAGHGIDFVSMTPNDDFIQADVTFSQAEKLLSTKYHTLVHSESGYSVPRTMSYHLPAELADAVDFVTPTVHVPPAPKLAKRTQEHLRGSLPKIGNTPKHLRELYSVTAEGAYADNKMAVTAFLNQHYHEKDLQKFWKEYCKEITCGKGLPLLVGTETTGLSAGIESMLDIETITGIAGNITSEFWGFKGKSPDNKANEPFMSWLVKMSNTSDADVPKVFSTSYGEDEDSWSLEAAQRLNVEFQKAGTRGISLLYASGDEGANCNADEKFKPETPGSSPWVTAVGGTTGSEKERAVGLSSGGFSDRWAMPDYQKAAVEKYLENSKIPGKKYGYNVTGRAYPDIAAQATDFTVVANGFNNPGVAGTSCATPTASGVIALVNDARLLAGKSVLGFLNPMIYSGASAWNDITSGSSSGCGFSNGWPAVEGWDAVTGVGTPNYKKLIEMH